MGENREGTEANLWVSLVGLEVVGVELAADAVCRRRRKPDSSELEPAWLGPKASLGLKEGGRGSGSGNVGAKVGRQSWNKAHWRSWRGRGVWAAVR